MGGTNYLLSIEGLYAVILVCLAIAVIQWIAVVWIGSRRQVLSSLDGQAGLANLPPDTADHQVRKVPFFRDGFFILWNLLPLVMGIPYIFLRTCWSQVTQGFEARFGAEHFAKVYQETLAFLLEPYLMIGLGVFALFSGLMQINKQRQFIQRQKEVYWWDWRVSKSIFVIRLVALITNMFIIVFFALTVGLLVVLVTRMVLGGTLTPAPFDLEGMGGLGFLSNLCSGLAIVFAYIAGMSLAGIFDHWRLSGSVGWIHRTFDLISLTAASVAVGWLLLFPALVINPMLSERGAEWVAMEELANERKAELKGLLESGNEASIRQWVDGNAASLLVLERMSQREKMPLFPEYMGALFSTFILPILVWVFFRLMNYLTVTEKGRSGSGLPATGT